MNSMSITVGVVHRLAARCLCSPALLLKDSQSCHLCHQSLIARQALHLLPPIARSVHNQQQHHQEPVFSDISSVITDAMSKAWSFDSLTTRLWSVQLTQPLVDRLLLFLKEPNNAKKALAFFHWSSRTRHFEHGLRSYCLIVHILVRAGLLIDAQALLESAVSKFSEEGSSVTAVLLGTYDEILPGRRVFDLLLQVYAKMRMVGAAFEACRYLGDHGFDANLITFNTMLQIAQSCDQTDLDWKMFEYMLVRRIYPNQKTTQVMIDVMRKQGILPKMVGVLDRIHWKRCDPGVIVATTLAFRMIEEGRGEEGATLLKRMLQKNMVFDNVAYSLILFAFCKMANLDAALKCWDEMINRGCSLNSFVYTCLIGSYSEHGNIEVAVRLMEEMLSIGLKPYDETYNHLLVGLSKSGSTQQCLKYVEKMINDRILPSCRTCNEILKTLCKSGKVCEANRTLTSLLDLGLAPDQGIYLSLIDGYGDLKNAQEILKLYYEMEHKGLQSGVIIYTSLIQNLCQCGKMNEAEKILTTMKKKALVPTNFMYNSLISGYCKRGDIQRTLLLYDKMIQKELVDRVPLSTMLVDRVNSIPHNQKASYDWIVRCWWI